MNKKKFLPLLSALVLFSGPAILVAACTSEITRYKGALSSDLQNRLLFDFVGVNYSVSAKSQFSSAFEAGMEFIKQEVEGIMAQQEFLNFFTKKLNYSEEDANATFTKVKDKLGLNILAHEYLESLNKKENFDKKVYASKLIFQTDNWHRYGTTSFEYKNVEFYRDNDPNTIFNSANLYSELDNKEKDAKIQEVAKHADKNYNKEIKALTASDLKFETPDTPDQFVPSLGQGETIQQYEKKVERFKWWLRFRYQQYYYSQILPKLNQTLFTMSYILGKALTINTSSTNQPKIEITNSDFASQLQDWGPNATWKSKYRFVWEKSVQDKTAVEINNDWKNNPLPELIKNDQVNEDFLKTVIASDPSLNNTIDPILGMSSFINDPSSKPYQGKNENDIPTTAGWKKNPNDSTMYWLTGNMGSFAYEAPIYWIDVIQNLDFNYYSSKETNSLVIDKNAENNKQWLSYWTSAENSASSNSAFSQFMRGPEVPTTPGADNSYQYRQELKWNTFWQMLYFIAAQSENNPNKEVAQANFTTAAKILFKKFIRKENIYNIDFWNAVKEYY